MPAEPIINGILDAIVTALAAIDTENGYHYTVATATRPQWARDGNHLKGPDLRDKPAWIVQAMGSRKADSTESDATRILSIALDCLADVDLDATPTLSSDTLAIRLCADAEKALLADYTLGGLAEFMVIAEQEFAELEDEHGTPYVGAGILLEVEFSYAYGAPY